jgi:6-phosphogluconolactonase (cycloisomerase 2 family)
MFTYVGCYTTPDRGGSGNGINAYRMDTSTGAWSHLGVAADVPNPSYLTLDPTNRFLYCVHGGNDFSAVSAFAIDASSGQLTPLGRQECGGPNPVALSVCATAPYLVVANYNTGTVASLPIHPDGSLGPIADLVPTKGEPGPHPTEQNTSHPHHIPYDPNGRFFVLPDKGFDRVFSYQLDPANGKILEGEPASVQARPGAAPRHAAFSPDAARCYVNNEIDSTLTTYAFDAERGGLEALQVVSTLPDGFEGRNSTAEIAVAPSGRFVYVSNRGHDSIAIFAVDRADRSVTPVAWVPTQGRTPRYFGLDPAGSFLYACNQNSDTIVTFRVDRESGGLTPTGQILQSNTPVCIAFANV